MKFPPWWGSGYFLELHNEALYQDGAASDVHDFSSRAHLLGQEELDDVQKALRKEVSIFERRESLLGSFKV